MAEEKKTAPKKKETETKKKTTKKTETKSVKEAASEETMLEYKGKPLVRSGKVLYYGDLNEPYVVCLMIKSEKEAGGVQVADAVQVQLLATDETLSPKDRVLKRSEKSGLFTALDLGVVWLDRQLKKG